VTRTAALVAAAALLSIAPATARGTPTRWTLAQARAFLASHELALVDRTQSDQPQFDVRFSRVAAASLTSLGRSHAGKWTTFRYDGTAFDTLRGIAVRLRFQLHPQPGGANVDHVRGPPPNRLQPTFPIRATFYYGWFPEAWDQEHVDPFTRYHPSLGFYDSGDAAVLRKQIAAMRYAHISAAVYSWWGPGSKTDSRFPLALTLARQTPFRWAVYYEAEGYGDPSAAQIHGDLLYLRAHYFSSPAYLHVDGRPVVFAYGDGHEDCSVATRWHDANDGIDAYLVLSAFGAREHVSYTPFESGGGVRVASGDVNGDARPELIAAAGSTVKVFGRDGAVIASFPTGDAGAVAVTSADVNGDGEAEVITSSDATGIVRVFSIDGGVPVQRDAFASGVTDGSIAAGDVDRDGTPEIVVGAGPGQAAVVKVFNAGGSLLTSFPAYDQTVRSGVSVAVGDVNDDGRSEIVTAAAGEVRMFSETGVQVVPAFDPYPEYTGPVSVAVGDTNEDGYADVVTGRTGSSEVKIFSLITGSASAIASFPAFDDASSGLTSVATADTNENGAAEVVAGSPEGREVRLLYGFRDCPVQPNGWHVYDSLHPESYLPPYEFGISPGFDRAVTLPDVPTTPRDLVRWNDDIADMNSTALPWHLVLTFNEWGEGTSVESAQEWATQSGYGAYLDALHAAG
jgi:hypothetical protein